MSFSHTPVLLQQIIDALQVTPGKQYIDATLGGAGHTAEILNRGGIVLGIDQDKDALTFVTEKLEPYIQDKTLTLAHGNFKDIKQIATEHNFTGVDAVLFDLGVSSYQLDDSGRGFTFRKSEPLDMRMDVRGEITARDIVNTYTEQELANLFEKYGEEINAKKIARGIVDARTVEKIETTGRLTQIIEALIPRREKINPSTRVFQALRIEVNQELKSLKQGIIDAFSLLGKEGQLAVISFHSLEDRIVKRQFEEFVFEGTGVVKTKKPITATEVEVKVNSRSRSAKLRIIQKK